MAKLQANITYKWYKQESVLLKLVIDNIELESNINCETEENDDDMNDEELNIEEKFQNQIDQFLEIDDNKMMM
ncbi:hypothetical protein GLOIN_2v1472823 [Rhizophagus clarus]|uniref:Uncharacterized protein n=1 Tax=Rhizophagus clarus TaxID=94130 RepID=A0A8H3LBH8_9GLOM|nr:hypothetical protein GLOIN_2v1472823 [Rhizophagus clarus]